MSADTLLMYRERSGAAHGELSAIPLRPQRPIPSRSTRGIRSEQDLRHQACRRGAGAAWPARTIRHENVDHARGRRPIRSGGCRRSRRLRATAWREADIEAVEIFPDLRRAYADGLVDPRSMHLDELDEVEAAPRGSQLEETRERYPPIDDVIEATSCGNDPGMSPSPPPRQSPIEPRQESDATNLVRAAAARSSRNVAAVDLRHRTCRRATGWDPRCRPARD